MAYYSFYFHQYFTLLLCWNFNSRIFDAFKFLTWLLGAGCLILASRLSSVSDQALEIPFEGNYHILSFSLKNLFTILTVDLYVFGLTKIVLLCGSGISLASLFATETDRFWFFAHYLWRHNSEWRQCDCVLLL